MSYSSFVKHLIPLYGCQQLDLYQSPYILHSNDLIDAEIGKILVDLIKPLQNNQYNYRHHSFIRSINNDKNVTKPQLQQLVSQFEHFEHYRNHNSNHLMNDIPISFAATIFSLNKKKFVTEINGLLYKNNVKLYTLIENIFIKFIPMFEWCLNCTFTDSDLSIIIKIQDYKFKNENRIIGNWHAEGDVNDDIVAVGLYYFDITSNKQLKFNENYFDIANHHCGNYINQNTKSISIKQNDCIVFKNFYTHFGDTTHRTRMSSSSNSLSNSEHSNSISRKLLSFFLINPTSNNNCKDFKWINFPWKVDILINYFINYNKNIAQHLYDDIILLIQIFAFGDAQYQQNSIIKIRNNKGLLPTIYDKNNDRPFGLLWMTTSGD